MRAGSFSRSSKAAFESAFSSYDVSLGKAEACWASIGKVDSFVKRRALMIDLSQHVKFLRDEMSTMTRSSERSLLLSAFGPHSNGGRYHRLRRMLSQMKGCAQSTRSVQSRSDEAHRVSSIDSGNGEDQRVLESTLTTFFLTYSLVSQIINVAKATQAWSAIKETEADSHKLAMTLPQELKPHVITDYYNLDDVAIGKGAFGSVYTGEHKVSGEKYAIKVITGSEATPVDGIIPEVEIHESLVHPNIARFFESFQQTNGCFLIMEFCSGGELFDRILAARQAPDADGMAVPETQAAKYIKQIAEGMAYLHGKGVAHRDLKPENFLLLDSSKEAQVKIIDMGFAKRFTEGTPMETQLGTVHYMAPEVIRRRYNEKCDVWSCGVVAYAILCGEVPFHGSTDEEILDTVMQGSWDFPSWMESDISAPGLDLIEEMLTMDPAARPSFAAICDHKWLTDHSYKRY